MRVVWKFPLAMEAGPQVVRMPSGALVVHVAAQDRAPTLWVEVHTEETSSEERRFMIVGTGDPSIPPGWDYRGTVFLAAFVFHVYEGRRG